MDAIELGLRFEDEWRDLKEQVQERGGERTIFMSRSVCSVIKVVKFNL